jgi:hypothetical protein
VGQVKKGKIVNLLFQVLAAFWAVIVITHARVSTPWHAYLIASVGVIVISVAGTRLKHRILKRRNARGAGIPVSASSQK